MLYHFDEGTKLPAGSIPPNGSAKLTKTQREGGHGWVLFLGHLVLCFELKEMASISFKGEVNNAKVKVSKGEVKVSKVDFSRTHGSS